MPKIKIETNIQASLELCFDLSRDVGLHTGSLSHTGERAVAGRTDGLLELGDEVTWRGRHFGIVLEHTARISQFDRPRFFRDEMIHGRFEFFRHDHLFEASSSEVRMVDILDFRSPLGILGWMVDKIVLAPYLSRLIRTRNAFIKARAEESLPRGDRSPA